MFVHVGGTVMPERAQDVHNALLAYWTSRDEAAVRQAQRGGVDVGGRAGVTAGGHLDWVAHLLVGVCINAGVPDAQVYYSAPRDDQLRRREAARGCTLPGYYRPTKKWDLVAYHQGLPIVVVELKSQNGPSYGNNANNRVEALGNAVDLARTCESGLLPTRPWTGYVFVLKDDSESRVTRGAKDRGFHPKDKVFADWSYADRIRILCQRLVEDNLYDAAWAVATSRPTCPSERNPAKCPQVRRGTGHLHEFGWSELDGELLGYARFIMGLTTHIRKYYSGGAVMSSRSGV
jgi:hypothetical protein